MIPPEPSIEHPQHSTDAADPPPHRADYPSSRASWGEEATKPENKTRNISGEDRHPEGVLMARPERPVDPASGPIHAFAADLRLIRDEAGNPTYLRMARASGRSRTALAEAAGGDHLPSWETVAAFVRACGQDPASWRRRWEHTRKQVHAERMATPLTAPSTAEQSGADSQPGEPPESAADVHDSAGWMSISQAGPSPSKPLPGRLLPILITALVSSGLTATSMHVLNISGHSHSEPYESAMTAIAVQVQNKVAIGPTELIEDTTPAYLSTRTIPFCSRRGCEVAGTTMWSGTWIAITCEIHGASMTNENLASPGVSGNAGGMTSTVWYRATLPHKVSGYISEVYVAPADRGGLDLPACPAAPSTS